MKNVTLTLVSILFSYMACELSYSYLYREGSIEPYAIWTHEQTDPNGNITFDPIMGYRISSTPSHMAVYTTEFGLESHGTMRGNNLGFAADLDFTNNKKPGVVRIAVFGDSYSAAQFIETNWPKRLNQIFRKEKKNIELYNFSIDGGGLANWWSIITKMLTRKNFQIDGFVFAIFANDLNRTFCWWDDNNFSQEGEVIKKLAIGYSNGFAKTDMPAGLDKVYPHFLDQWPVVWKAEMDKILARKIPPPGKRKWDIYLTKKLWSTISPLLGISEAKAAEFGPEQFNRIEEIANFVKTKQIPVLVLDNSSDKPELVQKFAQRLEAKYYDVRPLFSFSDPKEYAQFFIPHDHHWRQSGSDRFALHFQKPIEQWVHNKIRSMVK